MTSRKRPPASFTAETSALPMNYPGFLVRCLLDDGYDIEALLAGTNLTSDQFFDPYARMDFETLRRLIRNALQLTGDPHLGLRIAKRFEAHFIGPPAYAALNAPNLRAGLTVITRFMRLTFPALEFEVAEQAKGAEAGLADVQVRYLFPTNDLSYFVNGGALVALNGLLMKMLELPIVATRAEMRLSMPAGWAEIASQVSGIPVRFEATFNRILFPAELLDQALPCADPINHKQLVTLCEGMLANVNYDSSPTRKVQMFLERDPTLASSLSDVATALGYSERGLRRKLESSGTTFRALKDEARYERAYSLLLNTTRPIQDIADQLGYDSASNFARSFKRWTGQSPNAFREARRKALDNGQT